MLNPYGERFENALLYACQLHKKQARKGTDIPYVSHLLAVSSIVMEAGGDEDEVIAALLHDGPEDQGGVKTLDEIRARFGERVANIVSECSDTFEEPKPEWRERKENYLKHLQHVSQSTLKVSCADKLHNIRSILNDYKQVGEEVWQRFKGGKEGTLWYYQSLVRVYRELNAPKQIVDEISEALNKLIQFSNAG